MIIYIYKQTINHYMQDMNHKEQYYEQWPLILTAKP